MWLIRGRRLSRGGQRHPRGGRPEADERHRRGPRPRSRHRGGQGGGGADAGGEVLVHRESTSYAARSLTAADEATTQRAPACSQAVVIPISSSPQRTEERPTSQADRSTTSGTRRAARRRSRTTGRRRAGARRRAGSRAECRPCAATCRTSTRAARSATAASVAAPTSTSAAAQRPAAADLVLGARHPRPGHEAGRRRAAARPGEPRGRGPRDRDRAAPSPGSSVQGTPASTPDGVSTTRRSPTRSGQRRDEQLGQGAQPPGELGAHERPRARRAGRRSRPCRGRRAAPRAGRRRAAPGPQVVAATPSADHQRPTARSRSRRGRPARSPSPDRSSPSYGSATRRTVALPGALAHPLASSASRARSAGAARASSPGRARAGRRGRRGSAGSRGAQGLDPLASIRARSDHSKSSAGRPTPRPAAGRARRAGCRRRRPSSAGPGAERRPATRAGRRGPARSSRSASARAPPLARRSARTSRASRRTTSGARPARTGQVPGAPAVSPRRSRTRAVCSSTVVAGGAAPARQLAPPRRSPRSRRARVRPARPGPPSAVASARAPHGLGPRGGTGPRRRGPPAARARGPPPAGCGPGPAPPRPGGGAARASRRRGRRDQREAALDHEPGGHQDLGAILVAHRPGDRAQGGQHDARRVHGAQRAHEVAGQEPGVAGLCSSIAASPRVPGLAQEPDGRGEVLPRRPPGSFRCRCRFPRLLWARPRKVGEPRSIAMAAVELGRGLGRAPRERAGGSPLAADRALRDRGEARPGPGRCRTARGASRGRPPRPRRRPGSPRSARQLLVPAPARARSSRRRAARRRPALISTTRRVDLLRGHHRPSLA